MQQGWIYEKQIKTNKPEYKVQMCNSTVRWISASIFQHSLKPKDGHSLI